MYNIIIDRHWQKDEALFFLPQIPPIQLVRDNWLEQLFLHEPVGPQESGLLHLRWQRSSKIYLSDEETHAPSFAAASPSWSERARTELCTLLSSGANRLISNVTGLIF